MKMLIGGVWQDSQSGKTREVFNPADGTAFETIPDAVSEDVSLAAEAARTALSGWGRISPADKAKIFVKAGSLIREQVSELAPLLTTEQGKPLREARDEILGTAHVFEYYASMAGSLQGDAADLPKYGYLNVVRKPLGVCGAVIPWNMPAMIFGWKTGAALICGNTVVAKPSVTAPLTILKLAAILETAGVPAGAVNVVTGSGSTAGDAVVRHPDIRHISFTGSVDSGKTVALAAAPYLKKLTLELGGNDAFIVCRDADILQAAKQAVRNRFYNCGQVCTSAKRILVDQGIADRFVSAALAEMKKLSVGNGLLGASMGPLNNPAQCAAVQVSVERLLSGDAGKLVAGGRKISGPGCFFEPTLLTDVAPDSIREEIFGPVMPVIPFENENEALRIANGTGYGLGASVWTQNLKNAYTFAGQLSSGVVWINRHLILPPEMPFGGVGISGFGRENGREFIYEYTEPRSILVGF
jgi:acyl-CoA reductase-like NAD-dependent aldehyde dehydrogenase